MRPRGTAQPPRARASAFIVVWTLAVVATVCAFVVHLALRGRTVALGYELGRARAEQARLREVKRVLQLEAASYKTPERVEIVARTLLGMEPPPPDRIVPLAAVPDRPDRADTGSDRDRADRDRADRDRDRDRDRADRDRDRADRDRADRDRADRDRADRDRAASPQGLAQGQGPPP